jgi:Asp-tRNA(Asn)/Glu-tRNA(Gln) amidotransferase C subunit
VNDNGVSKLSGLSKIHFTLEELEEMNRDMESIIKLMDSIKDVELPKQSKTKRPTNIYLLRPDQASGKKNPPDEGVYYKIPRLLE